MANEHPTPASETYSIVRGQIEHIDNNLSQRVIWLVIAQSFFFSGYSILINGKPQKPELDPSHHLMVNIFPIAALLTVVFTSIDVVNSIRYMFDLRKFYEKIDHGDDTTAKAYPPIHGVARQRIWMHASTVLLPITFLVIWIIVLIVHFSAPDAPPPPPPAQ
jgi:hypothetical protein